MTKHHISHMCFALMLLLTGMSFAACSDNADNPDNDPEFTANWQARNTQYYDSIFTVAKTEIARAQATYGAQWEANCDWRVLPSYSKPKGGPSHDSICVNIVERGEASGISPLYLDSVKVNYMGHLIPTVSYPQGRIFDHSGIYENESHIFSKDYSVPARFAVSNLVEGFTTALLYMHVGDRWKVYIPQELGYMSASQGVLPAYSTLIFDLQLKGIARRGESF